MNSIKKKISFIGLFGLLAIVSPRLYASAPTPATIPSLSGVVTATLGSFWPQRSNLFAQAPTIARGFFNGIGAVVRNVAAQPGPELFNTGYTPSLGQYAATGTVLTALTPYLLYKMLPQRAQRGVSMVASGVTYVPRTALVLGAAWMLWRNYQMKQTIDEMAKEIKENEAAAQQRHKEATDNLENTKAELTKAYLEGNATAIAIAQANHEEANNRLLKLQRQADTTQRGLTSLGNQIGNLSGDLDRDRNTNTTRHQEISGTVQAIAHKLGVPAKRSL